jgi:proto-oncogene tyrosine-protein kinase ROS
VWLSCFKRYLLTLEFPCIEIVYRQKLQEKPALSPVSSERRELELATLRELPGGSSFVHESNILYGGNLILDLDLAGVPKISWHHITVTKFLGSGAFGEVYEGIASNLLMNEGPEGTRVAIKVRLIIDPIMAMTELLTRSAS